MTLEELDHMTVEDLIGVPFKLGARLPGPAVDCYGLVMEVCRRRGIMLPDPFTSHVRVMQAKDWILTRLTGWRRVEQPAAGVVVELVPGAGVPAHVGVLLDARRVLHADPQAGVIGSDLLRLQEWGLVRGFYVYG